MVTYLYEPQIQSGRSCIINPLSTGPCTKSMEVSESCMEWVNTFNVPTTPMLTMALMVFNPVEAMHIYIRPCRSPWQGQIPAPRCNGRLWDVRRPLARGTNLDPSDVGRCARCGLAYISGDSPRPGPGAWRRGELRIAVPVERRDRITCMCILSGQIL